MSFRAHGKNSDVSEAVRQQEEKRVKHVLRILRARFNEKVPTGDWNAMLRRFDEDGSGDLSKKEFVVCVRRLLGFDRETLSDHVLHAVVDHTHDDGSGISRCRRCSRSSRPAPCTGPTRHRSPRSTDRAPGRIPSGVDEWLRRAGRFRSAAQIPAAGGAAAVGRARARPERAARARSAAAGELDLAGEARRSRTGRVGRRGGAVR